MTERIELLQLRHGDKFVMLEYDCGCHVDSCYDNGKLQKPGYWVICENHTKRLEEKIDRQIDR